jgi:hypothetical protein
MKKLAIFLSILSVCLSGSHVFAIDPGTYNFGGTISLQSNFATGGTGDPVGGPDKSFKGYFCIQGLVVGDPDPVTGVQTITGSDNPSIDYGVFITPIRMIAVCVELIPTGQITGFIDNDGYQESATVTTSGRDCDFFGLPCGWATSIHDPGGVPGTVLMTIPLDSSLLQEPPPWVTYGDPAATSLTAIAIMDNEDSVIFGNPLHTEDIRTGVPLVGSSLNIVSPDVHFAGGIVLEDVLSWTRFNGTFSQGQCPAETPSWNSCSTIGPQSEASHAFNYLLILLLPALFIAVGVIGRRK